jgi:hypothetical protein
MKRKILMSVMAMILIMTSVIVADQNTYADEVKVNFKIRNHEAEVEVSEGIDGKKFELGEKIPKLNVRYRNAMKLSVKILNHAGEELKNEVYNVTLSNQFQNKEVDTSNLELKVGEYKVEAKGYNVDEKIKEDDAKFAVEMKTPEAPNTGEVKKEKELGALNNNLLVSVLSVLGITVAGALVLALRRKR